MHPPPAAPAGWLASLLDRHEKLLRTGLFALLLLLVLLANFATLHRRGQPPVTLTNLDLVTGSSRYQQLVPQPVAPAPDPTAFALLPVGCAAAGLFLGLLISLVGFQPTVPAAGAPLPRVRPVAVMLRSLQVGLALGVGMGAFIAFGALERAVRPHPLTAGQPAPNSLEMAADLQVLLGLAVLSCVVLMSFSVRAGSARRALLPQPPSA